MYSEISRSDLLDITMDLVAEPCVSEQSALIPTRILLDWMCYTEFTRFYFDGVCGSIEIMEMSIERKHSKAIISCGRSLMTAYWQTQKAWSLIQILNNQDCSTCDWFEEAVCGLESFFHCVVSQLSLDLDTGYVPLRSLWALRSHLDLTDEVKLTCVANEIERAVIKLRGQS